MAEPSFQKLRPSRKRLRPGDVFVMKLPTDEYLFGRVIRTDATWPLDREIGAILVYVYSYRAREMTPPGRLDPADLLIPPRLTNTLGWSRGYFETVEHRPLEADEILPVHSFRTRSGRRMVILGERGRPVTKRARGPVGDWGLDSYASINYDVCKALGLPSPID